MLQGDLNGVEFNGVAGRRGEPKPCPEDRIVSSIVTDPILRMTSRRKQSTARAWHCSCEAAELEQRVSKVKTDGIPS